MPTGPWKASGDRSGECGFTLVELLVAMVVAIMLFGIVGGFLVTSVREETRVQGHADGFNETVVAMQRMTREIRQATDARLINGQTIDVVSPIYENGNSNARKLRRVRYECQQEWGMCVRTIGTSASLTAQIKSDPVDYLAHGLVNDSVFTATKDGVAVGNGTYLANMDYLEIAFRLRTDGKRAGSATPQNVKGAQRTMDIRAGVTFLNQDGIE